MGRRTRLSSVALDLARQADGRVTLLHVVEWLAEEEPRASTHFSVPEYRRYMVEDAQERLRNLVAEESRTWVEIDDLVVFGRAHREILRSAETKPADLIVMGTHGRRGFKRLLLGSVTEAILREAPCPVLTVPPQASASVSEAVTFKRILCPIDFSPSALQALGFALDLARQADGRVTLMHVIEWLAEDDPKALAHFNVPEYQRHLVADAADRLRLLVAEESRTWVEIDNVVVLGRSHREILHAAAAMRANLIVMGAQGRGGVELALFGSTTQQVVRSAACPVLTVRGSRLP